MVPLDFLKKMEIFKGLEDANLVAVQEFCRETEFHRGDTLFFEGEDANRLYTVMEGRIDLLFGPAEKSGMDRKTVVSLGETDSFGWSSMVSGRKRTLSCYCASGSCKVVEVDGEHLTRLFERDQKLGYQVMSNIASLVARRFLELQDRIAKQKGEELMANW